MQAIESMVGKGENAGKQDFFSFSDNVFYPFTGMCCQLSYILFIVYILFWMSDCFC